MLRKTLRWVSAGLVVAIGGWGIVAPIFGWAPAVKSTNAVFVVFICAALYQTACSLMTTRKRAADLDEDGTEQDAATAYVAAQMTTDDSLQERVCADLGNRASNPDALRAWFVAMIQTKPMASMRDTLAKEALTRADWQRIALTADGNVDWNSLHRNG